MLQIVTKMYFRDGVPLNDTVHRDILYTNCSFLRSEVIELPVGTLTPSTPASPVSTVTVSITEHVEALELDGTRAIRISTGGLELVDDLGVVLSYGLNAIFSRNRDLVQRLVPDTFSNDRGTQASRLFGRTFEANRYVPPAEFDQLRRFMEQLLALRRDHYEAAMRAIRRIVGATQRAADDPTLAYVDIVAALESLSASFEAPAVTWDRLDARKRQLIGEALETVDEDAAERVRAAVMEGERLGVTARFLAFVLASVSPDYFRADAVGIANPTRRPDLERAVKQAYAIRSLNVHALRELQDEAWILGAQTETLTPPGGKLMLSHAGLARLARHVVRSYVATAPTGVDPTFNWRASLPGQLQMRAAPQYWLSNATGFGHQSVGHCFSGFVEHLIEVLARRAAAITNITAVLERIEVIVPGLQDSDARAQMVAIYALWHRVVAPEHQRPTAPSFLGKYEAILRPPGMPAFATRLLLGEVPSWTASQWQALAIARWATRSMPSQQQLPAPIDAALHIFAADELAKAGSLDAAREHAAYAAEELPGDEAVLAWETNLGTDQAAYQRLDDRGSARASGGPCREWRRGQ